MYNDDNPIYSTTTSTVKVHYYKLQYSAASNKTDCNFDNTKRNIKIISTVYVCSLVTNKQEVL